MQYAYVMGLIAALGVPALIVLPFVERAESFGRVLIVAMIAGALGLISTEFIMRTEHHFSAYQEYVARSREYGAQITTVYEQAKIPHETIAVTGKFFELGLMIVPAFFLMEIATSFILSLVMFGRLKAWRDYVARRQRPEGAVAPPAIFRFRGISLPDWLLFAFIIGGLTPLASGMLQTVAANILAIVAFLYFIQGLAIFHSMLAAVGVGFGGKLITYGLLSLLMFTGVPQILLSITGLFDSFFDFRHFRRKDHSDESHPH